MTHRLVVLFLFALLIRNAVATDFVQLTSKNWDKYVPQGKEVDAIYGDYVLRNDKIVVIIAKPGPVRDANLTIRDIGGFILDLTSVDQSNDQLGCYYPLGGSFHFHNHEKMTLTVDGSKASGDAHGKQISVAIESTNGPSGEKAKIVYTLADGSPWLKLSHTVTRNGKEVRAEKFNDSVRADRLFAFGTTADGKMFWANDAWFGQCYGAYTPDGKVQRAKGRGAVIEFSQKTSTTRLIAPANSLLAAKGLAAAKSGESCSRVRVKVTDPRGPVAHANITLSLGGKSIGSARTLANGACEFLLPHGEYEVTAKSIGQPDKQSKWKIEGKNSQVKLAFESNPPIVDATILDESGGGVPCKVAFFGKNGTADPDLGPDAAANPVKNLYYSHNGRFQVDIPAGNYDVIVSRGPEYDAEFLTIQASAGNKTPVKATLRRVVKTPGWVSTEYHSHSSPSGDNVSDQLGRVLNLVGEQLEFAPCTEHQRIDSYVPHIKALKIEKWISTCSGMELTGNPLPLNHQNAFPLVHRPRTQNGGGPRVDPDPVVQIERIAYWDNKSEKLVQSNHPNLIQMTGDANLDGKADKGFRKMFDFMDVMEVHPPQSIFNKPDSLPSRGRRGNTIFNWMQLLNHGYRIVGVVNTDAHYNFHGSGWLRNYVASSTDDPARIDTMEMVRNSKKGRVVMTTGPYMKVTVQPAMSKKATVGPGEDLKAPSGKVNVHVQIQCPNWLDVNRVQIFVNGEAKQNLNFTRRANAKDFRNGVIKFDKTIAVELEKDAHIIVATIGEGLTLGRVMGPRFGTYPPCAVANPVFVDVDGNGFQSNNGNIGAPFLIEKK